MASCSTVSNFIKLTVQVLKVIFVAILDLESLGGVCGVSLRLFSDFEAIFLRPLLNSGL